MNLNRSGAFKNESDLLNFVGESLSKRNDDIGYTTDFDYSQYLKD